VYDTLLEDCGKHAKVANNAVKKMKKIEEDYRCTLVQLKKAKCEVEGLKENWWKLILRSSFLNLKLFNQMSRLSAFPPRNLTVYYLLKNLHMTRPV